MKIATINRLIAAPKFNREAILKYAQCKQPDEQTISLLDECLYEATTVFVYKVSYVHLPIIHGEDYVDLSFIKSSSKLLCKTLADCDSYVLFVATIGIGIDRLIRRYARTSPAKSLMFQAIGTERVEALCNSFTKELKKNLKVKTTRRVSPGYGDIPLEMQRDIFNTLDFARSNSIFLSDSCIMTPSKSVTAFIGIKK